ncbi:hypothetical protein G6O69_16460 [Pseudenhygromyxa sp. WMMC2535]|uniref:hypothetical protein n=1 Tax=Pseudenhygromyxa sp. WMMC2535 TaxID=2712867 RepID=UPI001552FADC|nr:hypothetical protein [Pseudenhygromyxa sp. WMMC2535]NVB39436.1 hypothetical protein [Pseudenhygromyxa sp. WMMC2535]
MTTKIGTVSHILACLLGITTLTLACVAEREGGGSAHERAEHDLEDYALCIELGGACMEEEEALASALDEIAASEGLRTTGSSPVLIQCGGGETVMCSGLNCLGYDGLGCFCTNLEGVVSEYKMCNSQ